MKKNIKNVNRKECSPEQTISKIKALLESLDIQVNETAWESFANSWYSVRIEINGLPNIGVNGKGVTREFALASAYGELMERLQSRALIRPTFGSYNIFESVFYDEIDLSLENLFQNCSDILKNFTKSPNLKKLKDALKSNLAIRRCIPFYSMTERKIQYLPYKLINMCCGSNGLCAGNTKEEAIIQGISEIFERYVHRNIFNQNIELVDISIDRIQHLHSYSLIQQIIKEGYSIIVKDCSMPGTFPVIGLLIFNKNKDRYKFVLGCDPDIDIALQRCVTEMFQGVKFDSSFEKKMIKIDWNVFNNFSISREKEWVMATINNSGHHPINIFNKQKNATQTTFFFNQHAKSNKEYLEDAICKLKQLGYNIFVRNYSYLGFPCYRVYIPSMSEWAELSDAEMFFLQNEYSIKKTYCNLKSSNINELFTLKQALLQLNNISKYKFYGFPRLLGGLIIDKAEEQEKLNYNLIMFLISIQLKNQEDALKFLNYFIDGNEKQFSDVDYIQAMRFFLIMYSVDLKKWSRSYLVNPKILNGICFDYKNGRTISRYELPSCPDCEKCNIEKCYYDKWKHIDEKLKKFERRTALSQDYTLV